MAASEQSHSLTNRSGLKNELARIKKEEELKEERRTLEYLADIENRQPPKTGKDAVAVYVIGSKLGVKIGISDDPANRLDQLQTGHPNPLKFVKAFWFLNRSDAGFIERTTHHLLNTFSHKHLHGEWFQISESQAVEAVRETIRESIKRRMIDQNLRGAGITSFLVALNVSKRNSNENSTPPNTSKDNRPGIEIDEPKKNTLPETTIVWEKSKKGNYFVNLPKAHITVFRHGDGWKYVCNDDFDHHLFNDVNEAKLTALNYYKSEYGNFQ